jgi:isoleucyl-tRNA synthetase
LPLAELTVVAENAPSLADFSDILRDELNVKNVSLVAQTPESAQEYGITSKLTVNARAAGPRLGKAVQQIIHAAKEGNWSEVNGVVTAGGVALEPGEYELTLEASEGQNNSRALSLLPGGGFVLLDTVTTPELEAEGLARDVIRAVQDTRKAAGFDVSDRIVLNLFFFDATDASALKNCGEADIAAETLATSFGVHDPDFHAELAGFVSVSPAEWLPAMPGGMPEHFAVLPAGQYANAGDFVIALSRVNRVVNV